MNLKESEFVGGYAAAADFFCFHLLLFLPGWADLELAQTAARCSSSSRRCVCHLSALPAPSSNVFLSMSSANASMWPVVQLWAQGWGSANTAFPKPVSCWRACPANIARAGVLAVVSAPACYPWCTALGAACCRVPAAAPIQATHRCCPGRAKPTPSRRGLSQ